MQRHPSQLAQTIPLKPMSSLQQPGMPAGAMQRPSYGPITDASPAPVASPPPPPAGASIPQPQQMAPEPVHAAPMPVYSQAASQNGTNTILALTALLLSIASGVMGFVAFQQNAKLASDLKVMSTTLENFRDTRPWSADFAKAQDRIIELSKTVSTLENQTIPSIDRRVDEIANHVNERISRAP